jgi:geranylgeranyl diphosphate synthase type I
MFPVNANNVLTLKILDAFYKGEMPTSNSRLTEAARYHFKYPGKSFRAQLALSSGTALGLNEHDSLHWAAACELLHNASLIHDDISDSSTHRRGQESIRKHFGSDIALCLGDWMIAKAFELASRNRGYGGLLVGLLAQSMQETCSGQISDITQRQCAELDEWKRIAKGKTAPLLIAPMKGAALAAGLNSNLDSLKSLEKLMVFCGLAYQGRNDIDDIVPSSHRSSDLDGRKPNLVISLFAQKTLGRDNFNTWYMSSDNLLLTHWQRRIASSDAILHANEFVDYWLVKAEQLLNQLPTQLQPVACGLVASVKQKIVIKCQGGPVEFKNEGNR